MFSILIVNFWARVLSFPVIGGSFAVGLVNKYYKLASTTINLFCGSFGTERFSLNILKSHWFSSGESDM